MRDRIQPDQQFELLERRAASTAFQLHALKEFAGAQIHTVVLTPSQVPAATEHWLALTTGGPTQAPDARVHPADLSRLRGAIADYLGGEAIEFDLEFRLIGGSGQWEWIRQRAAVGSTHPDGSPREVFVIQTSHTALYRATSLQQRQSKILDQLVAGADLEQVLTSLLLEIEAHYVGALATVSRLDEATGKLHHLAGPSLPAEFHAAFDGLTIGPGVGACGAAAFEKQRVVLVDLMENESCRPYRGLFAKYGLRAIWSQPITGSRGTVIGTFAIYHREPHAPDADEIRLIENAANLACLAMERWTQIDALLQNEKRFRQLASLARLFPWDYDVETARFTYMGPQVETILGYAPNDLLERDRWTSIVHPDDFAALASRAQHPEQFGENFAFEYRVIARDGRVVWLHGLFAVVFQGDQPIRLQGFSLDVTDRKLAEEKLRESEERYRMLADYSSDMIARLDSAANFLYVSPACRPLLGYEPEQLLGHCAFDLVHADDLATLRNQWELLATQRQALGTYRIRRADGEYVWFETRGRQRSNGSDAEFEVVATSRDVTDQVEAARKLRQREAELAHAERLSTMGQMAAELAHELNQPLQAISNFSEAARHWLLTPGEDLEPLKRWTNQIALQANRAAEVVRRILNFVRKGELDPTSFELTACVRGLQPLLEMAARNHGAKIDYQLAADLPELVADRLLIEQVVVNLFRNALEAMVEQPREQRVVTVRTYLTPDSQIGLAIEDCGRGVDAEEVSRLFEPYFTTKSDGTGMGLAICRSTIDAHHGRIWTESNDRGGATFRFVLPLHSPFAAQIMP